MSLAGAARAMVWIAAILATVPAVIGLIFEVTTPQLAPLLQQMMSAWASAFDAVFDALYAPLRGLNWLFNWGWSIPQWVQWLHALSFIGPGLLGRAISGKNAPKATPERFTEFLKIFAWGASFYGLVAWIMIVGAMAGYRSGDPQQARTYNLVSAAGWIVFGAVGAFFLANAVLLHGNGQA